MIEEMKPTPYLTTVDNDWNPFTQFDAWFAYDVSNSHHSCSVLARIALCSDELSDEENRQELERAIDRIIEIDPEKKFVKVYKDTFEEDMRKARQEYSAWLEQMEEAALVD